MLPRRLSLCLSLPWLLVASALSQPVSRRPQIGYLEAGFGNGMEAFYRDGTGERFEAESAQGLAVLGSGYEKVGNTWWFGGRAGTWIATDPSYTDNGRCFSVLMGLSAALLSRDAGWCLELGAGGVAAGSSGERSEVLFSTALYSSVRKFWMLSERVGIGPGVHLMIPLFGQLSVEGAEWLVGSIGLTLVGP